MIDMSTQQFVNVAKAKQIYQERIRPTLTQGDKGKFVTINIQTCEHEIDEDNFAGARRVHPRFGKDAPLLTIRAGYKAAAKRAGSWLDLEEANW